MTLWRLSAIELSRGLAWGDFSSEEVVRSFLARHAEVGARSRAFVVTTHEEAVEEARRLDAERARGEVRGPLHGLPLSVKENIDLAGQPSTLGLRGLAGHRAAADAITLRHLRKAGMIVLGKTNVPQALASGMECENHLYGNTFHPMSRRHGPGGSSSGEAVALATGESLFGVGSDLGGSIRFPAAYCGVAGLKPTTDRWSNGGVSGAIPGQEVVRAQIGPLARSAADLRFFWQSFDPAPMALDDPQVPPLSPAAAPAAGPIRIGYFEEDGLVRPARAIVRALREARAALEARGHVFVPLPPGNQRELVELYVAVLGADGLRTVARRLGGERPVPPFRTMWRVGHLPGFVRRLAAHWFALTGEPRLAAMARVAGERRVDELYALTARRAEWRREELAAWNAAGVDALLCPPTTTAAVPVGLSHDFALTFGYTGRFNVFGFPAGVVRVGAVRAEETTPDRLPEDRIDRRILAISKESEGLPLSVQVVTRPFQEDRLLDLLVEIEAGTDATGGLSSFVDPVG